MFSQTFIQGLWVSLYGLGGVFTVLILFYAVTKIMVKAFAGFSESNNK